ncbi:MAG TPA: sulfatase-like hydrolase/transferase, partial [bacterium]|nr:sulfatase-like hydrolase/transferase [bacterium]
LDAWARSGSLVRWAIADVPLTLPSHATLMTSIPASGHGVRTNVAYGLGDGAETLAERFRGSGFRTAAVVSTRVLRAETGIGQGFDAYDDEIATPSDPVDAARYPPLDPGPPTARRADEAVGRALAQLDEGAAPRFLWLHLFDAHAVYDPPAPWERAAPDLYHAEIAFLDGELRRLARRLEEADLRDRVVLAVTADHGEGLEDHREAEHGLFVYDEAVRVPLLMCGAGVPRTLLDEQVRTVDLAPTLLDLAGVDAALGLGGSLLPALAGTGPVPSGTAYCESMRPKLSHGAAPLKAWRTRDTKFVWAPVPERYDLAADPGERVNLAAGDAAGSPDLDAARDRLAALLEAARAAAEPAAVPLEGVDEDVEARLASLGYAGGGAGAGRPSLAEELARDGYDPKWIVDVAMAGRDLDVGLWEDARRKLDRFAVTVPGPDALPELRPLWATAHENRGLLALHEGRPADAASEYRRALGLSAASAAAREGRVRALVEDGRYGQAVEEADAMLALHPEDVRLRVFRALALALSGRLDEARRAFVQLDAEGYPPEVRQTAVFCRDRLDAGDSGELLALLTVH